MTIKRQWGYVGPDTKLGEIYGHKDSYMAAQPLGFLTITGSWLPKPPGHISNSCSFRFPRPLLLHRRRQSKDDPLGRYEHSGCADRSGEAGRSGRLQGHLRRLRILRQLPGADRRSGQHPRLSVERRAGALGCAPGLRSDQKVGLICADRPNLTVNTFLSCGMTEADYDSCVIYGGNEYPIFDGLRFSPGRYDCEELKQEISTSPRK
jgi:hypothetical protein